MSCSLFISVVLIALLIGGCAISDGVADGMGDDQPGDGQAERITWKRGRSPVIARNGIVATSQPLAAQVGLDILKQGGTAADAAIAANAVIGLTEPMSCGIGGDLFVIYYDAKTGTLHGLNASGRSPYGLNRDVFAEKSLKSIPAAGPLAWSVPGCVKGWEDLHEKFGSMPMKQLMQPAIDHAEDGFPVGVVTASYWRASEGKLKQWPDSATTYLPDGHAPRTGDVFRNPNLANTYRLIGEHGADAFYKGEIAEKIVAFSEAHGGYFTLKDFEDHTSTWVEPVSTNYRGFDVWELPPNGQGIAALQMLNVLEAYDIKSMGNASAAYYHLLIEAKKLAFVDRAKFYSDPEFNDLPVKELISKPYADTRRSLIDESKAATTLSAGDPKLEKGDTIYMTVVDKDGNCCSLIQSNYYGFGSGVTPGDLGFVLQNRGNLFALDPDHFNTLEPHKRPFHTIIPAMVTKDGKPWFCYGVMGGDMQPQGHVQVLINIIDFGMNVQEAGEAPRIRHYGSPTPTGDPGDRNGGTVMVEREFPSDIIEALKAKGHNVRIGAGGFGGYQGIHIDESGVLHGGSEPRNDGQAVGY